jgi:hypothetical protein
MRHLYLAATGQNRGKTTVALGLVDGFRQRGLLTGFLKPVGQRTVIEEGAPADEDAVLMKRVFGLDEPLAAMSPVHIPRGFTKAYIDGAVSDDLPGRIRSAHEVFVGHDMVLVEGTGHAGVGAVVGLSNAVVAGILGTPVIIVSEGGVGRPIDEIVLNRALFERYDVPIAGAIVNKVDLIAQPELPTYLERGLTRHGIPLLGVLPYQHILSNPTLAMVSEGVHGETLHAGPSLDRVIDGVAIGAMEPHHMLQRVGPGTLVIVPGDREDAILALTTAHLVGRARSASPLEAAGLTDPPPPDVDGQEGAAVGLVLTGGYRPREAVVAAIRGADLFATLVAEDTYTVASEVHDLLVKTHAADEGKIALIKSLVATHLDVDRILDVSSAA